MKCMKLSDGGIVLFIDELHMTLIGAGAGGQALDASNTFWNLHLPEAN